MKLTDKVQVIEELWADCSPYFKIVKVTEIVYCAICEQPQPMCYNTIVLGEPTYVMCGRHSEKEKNEFQQKVNENVQK